MEKRAMRKISKKETSIIVTAALLLCVLIFAIWILYKPAKIDCGTDNDCFKTAGGKCAPATFTLKQNGEISQFELKEAEGQSCIVNITLSESTKMTELVGQGVICKVLKTEIAAKGYVAISPVSDNCEGQMKDTLLVRFGQ